MGRSRRKPALNRRGNPADGKVNGTVKGEFDLEPGYGGAVHGDVVGTLVVPQYDLAPGLTYLHFRFAETNTMSGPNGDAVWLEISEIHAPFNEIQFDLLAGEDYWFEIEYAAEVPYGSIGSHATSFEIPILSQGGFYGVPEPGTLALLATGLLFLLRPRIRRARRTRLLGACAGGSAFAHAFCTHKDGLRTMRKKAFLPLVFSLFFIQPLACSTKVEAASVLDAFVAEPVAITTQLHLKYEDFTGYSDNNYYTNSTGGLDVSYAPPASSNPNDSIDAQISLGLEFGEPVSGATFTNDTFVFDASGEIRVQDARTTRGHPADGTIVGTATAEFALEPGFGGAEAGDLVGMLAVPPNDLAPNLTYLDFRFHEYSGDNWVTWVHPAPFEFFTQWHLFAGVEYMIEIEYEAHVPYGSIASHSTNFEIWLLPEGDFYTVPEPGTLALLAIGLLCLVHPRMRRTRRTLPLGQSAGNGCSLTTLNPLPTHKNPRIKMQKKTWLLILLSTLLIHPLACSTPAKAASVLDAFAPDNTSLTTKIHMQYTDFTGYTDEDWFIHYYHVDPDDGPNGYAFWDESLPPASSSNPNDGIDAQISLGLEFGHPVSGSTTTNDTFVFDASGEIRVQDARTTRGHPADGKIIGTATAEFDLEPGYGGAVHGDVVGMLVVPETNLAPGLTYLDFRFAVTQSIDGTNGSPTWLETLEMHAPFNEIQFDLLAGADYWFEIEYAAEVPYGSIGSHATNFEIPIIPVGGFYGVPEPATLLLALLGLALLPRRRRR